MICPQELHSINTLRFANDRTHWIYVGYMHNSFHSCLKSAAKCYSEYNSTRKDRKRDSRFCSLRKLASRFVGNKEENKGGKNKDEKAIASTDRPALECSTPCFNSNQHALPWEEVARRRR
jgi:hypothetical protein